MKIIHLLNLLTSFMIVYAHYSLYHSDNRQESNGGFDCLYAYLLDFVEDENVPFLINYHLIPYCRRLDQNEEEENLSIQSYENIENSITFAELYRQNVTSQQLLDWLAPIDIVEQYEENGKNSNELFHNCSLTWFGSKCQYKFEHDLLLSFSNAVKFIFAGQNSEEIAESDQYFTFGTCYSFLTSCYAGPSPVCLSWREICDGKFDCINGEDEQLCQLLEVNECSDNEFRCHYGGQCIPSVFVRDGKTSTDCLDGTDEVSSKQKPKDPNDFQCLTTPTFQCEELNTPRSLTPECFTEMRDPGVKRSCFLPRNVRIFFNIIGSVDHIFNTTCRELFFFTIGLGQIIERPLSLDESLYKESLIKQCSSEWLVLPKYPIAFGFFQFIYSTNLLMFEFEANYIPTFICFNASRCPALVFCSVDIENGNDLNCCNTTNLLKSVSSIWFGYSEVFKDLVQRCLTIGTDRTCSHSSLFHCPLSSKCISKHRLLDGFNDCYFGEDESFPTCQLNDSSRFICQLNPKKCLSIVAVGDEQQDCQGGEDELIENQQNNVRVSMSFSILCDGEYDLLWSNMSNETDETHCKWWPCNTPYFRCDNVWHCLNGADELNCPETKCLSNEHTCKLYSNYQVCIPNSHIIEKFLNRNNTLMYRSIYIDEKLIDRHMNYFLWNKTKCITSEQIYSSQMSSATADEEPCLIQTDMPSAYKIVAFVEKAVQPFRCALTASSYFERKPKRFLVTSRFGYFPSVSTIVTTQQDNQYDKNLTIIQNMPKISWYCHRGILIKFKTSNRTKCLCPPSYFGNQCQWQNQRVSLTLQLIYRTFTYTMSVFQVIIMIIDEQRQISPYHEQIIHIPKHDCSTKFNLYLLYPNRPKNLSANYSIHIDIFDKITLKYWASWHLSIPFQFLPVNRIATQLFIPSVPQIESCPLSCGTHGRCMKYINKHFLYFCQCDQGYSGLRCNIKHNCSCSSDSFCLSSSICICPLNKFGSKCYLKYSSCQSSNNPCQNNGSCIPTDDRININQFRCLCTQGFYGPKCEHSKNKIDIEFNDEIIEITPAVFVHFISAFEDTRHERTTTLKKIIFGQNKIKLAVTQPFHALFVELFNKSYYLTVLREKFIESEYIQTKLLSNQRCIPIHELLNSTLHSYSYLHRVKYYPLLCRQNKQLMCFYDEHYMCICDLDRFSNCFTFDHNRTYNCQGYIGCENGGQCFQDNITCPSISICVCSDCFYGTKCQFSTKGLVLSLDYILGYHIKPNVSFIQQPLIIKMSVAITTIMFVFGLINGILSLSTFRRKKTRESGCGFYLLVSSWISIFIIIILIIKFWHLILSQMSIFTNRSLLTINCILLDMFINALLVLNDWLDACVSVERVITVIKGVHFNKSKSKRMAKWITVTITIFTILTHLPDPLYRHLIDDINEDEQRTWCLVQNISVSLGVFNQFITLFHFLIPFSMNLISTILMVISISRFHSTMQPGLTFKQHLRLQFKKYKYQLITLCALILLALPRLIISFISGCMKSPNNSWLFLFGYLMSFLPSMLTLIVFILPSKIYKDEFNDVISRTIRRFRSTFSMSTSV